MARTEQVDLRTQGPSVMSRPEGLKAAEVKERAYLSPGLVLAEGDARTPTTQQGRSAWSTGTEERLN